MGICLRFGFFSRIVWGFCFVFDLFGEFGISGFVFSSAICLGILGLIWSRFVLGFVDFSSRFVWGFLLSFLRDLFGDLRISGFAFLAICVGILGFGDFFHDWFGEFGICFFFRDLFGDVGIWHFFHDLFREFGIWGFVRDLFGDLGGFGVICFLRISFAFLARFVLGVRDLFFFARFVWGLLGFGDFFAICLGIWGFGDFFFAICLGI